MNKFFVLLIVILLSASVYAKTDDKICLDLCRDGYYDINIGDNGYIFAKRYGKTAVFYYNPKIGKDSYELIIKPGDYDKVTDNTDYLTAYKDGNKFFFVNGKLNANNDFEKVLSEKFSTYNINGKWKLTYRGKDISKTLFDSVELLNEDYVKVKKDNKYGLYRKDEIVLEPIYDSFKFEDKNFIIVAKDKKYGIFYNNELKIPAEYDNILKLPKQNYYTYYKVKKNNKYGIISPYDGIIIPVEYDDIKDISIQDGSIKRNYLEIRKNNKSGIVDDYLKIIVPAKYDKISILPISEGESWYDFYIKTQDNKKYGLLTRTGENILPAEYDNFKNVSIYDNGILRPCFIVQKNKKYGLLNSWHELILPIEYDKINAISFGGSDSKREYIEVQKNRKYGLFDAFYKDRGIPAIYDKLEYSQISKYNCVTVMSKGKKGLYLVLGSYFQLVTKGMYDDITVNEKPLYWTVVKNGKKGVYDIDRDGFEVNSVPADFDEIKHEFGHLYKVCNYNKCGLYDSRHTDSVIPVAYDDVKMDKKVGFGVYTFVVRKDNNYGAYNVWYLDDYSKQTVPAEFDSIIPVHNGYIVTKNGKQGFYHVDKGLMLKPVYEIITCSKNGKTLYKKHKYLTTCTKIPKSDYEKDLIKSIKDYRRTERNENIKILLEIIFTPRKFLEEINPLPNI